MWCGIFLFLPMTEKNIRPALIARMKRGKTSTNNVACKPKNLWARRLDCWETWGKCVLVLVIISLPEAWQVRLAEPWSRKPAGHWKTVTWPRRLPSALELSRGSWLSMGPQWTAEKVFYISPNPLCENIPFFEIIIHKAIWVYLTQGLLLSYKGRDEDGCSMIYEVLKAEREIDTHTQKEREREREREYVE